MLFLLLALQLLASTTALHDYDNFTTLCRSNYSLDNLIVIISNESVQLEENCRISDVANLTIRGISDGDRATVSCPTWNPLDDSSSAFVFTNVSNLVLENINFVGCGNVLGEQDLRYPANSSFFYFSVGQAAVLVCNLCHNLSLSNVHFSNNTGYSFVGIDLFGESQLDNVVVDGKDDLHLPYNSTICKTADLGYLCGFRGVLILFVDVNSSEHRSSNSTVLVHNSVFDSNYNALLEPTDPYYNIRCLDNVFTEFIEPLYNQYPLPDVGGLTIVYNQENFSAEVDVRNSTFINNRGMCFGAALVLLVLPSSDLGKHVFQDCTFFNNSPSVLTTRHSYIGDDLTVYLQLGDNTVRTQCFSLTNSYFGDHYSNSLETTAISVTCFSKGHGNCVIYLENLWTNITTRLLSISDLSKGANQDVFLKDIRVIDESTHQYHFNSTPQNSGIMTFFNIPNVTLHGTSQDNCRFHNLIGPVILLQFSELYLLGEMTFSNNVASKWAEGGAIMLQVNSLLWFQEPVSVLFCNNSAVSGGAIGSSQLVFDFCALQYRTTHIYNDHNIDQMNVSVTFRMNSANLAGNSIYVNKLFSCSMRNAPLIRVTNVRLAYLKTFTFEEEADNGLLEMSSMPVQACVCLDETNSTSAPNISCTLERYQEQATIYTYPGKDFSLNVTVVDDSQYPVYSTLYNSLIQRDLSKYNDTFDLILGYNQNIVVVHGSSCARLNFTIYTSINRETEALLTLYPYNQADCIAIPVTVKPCPLGLMITKGGCDCCKLLDKHEFTCDVNELTFTNHLSTLWVGLVNEDFISGNKTLVAYASHCPIKYCNNSMSVVRFGDFDSVCLYNRSGILCGQCIDGKSSVLGHPMCQTCSNYYLLTILLYGLLGIMLVVLLFALRLTIVSGTVNSVIFYANILNINTNLYFGFDSTILIRMFISTLNLNLGIAICFYDGMTPLAATYLSYIVPVYLWLIFFVIIFLSRRFQVVSRITSRSAIPVLATLIHLSFSKVLRLVSDGLIFEVLDVEREDGTIDHFSVWYSDGSVLYFSKWHIGLFLMSVFFLLFYLIPYTIFLTGIKFFVRFRFTERVRPFIDAFCAPYKDKWRFWFGLRLCVLIVIYTTYTSMRNFPYVVLLIQIVIFLVFTIVQATIMPYKNTLVNYIDLFFLANTILVCVLAIYARDYTLEVGIHIIVTPAFLVFCGIVGYHLYLVLKPKLPRWFFFKKKKEVHFAEDLDIEPLDKESSQADSHGERTSLNSTPTPITYASLIVSPHDSVYRYKPGELREPLLET